MADIAVTAASTAGELLTVLPTGPDDTREVSHDVPEDDLLRIHRMMTLTRAFDQRGMRAQRQGRLGFYLPSNGEEALQIGSAYALEERDWLFPHYRVPGVALWRGADLDQLVANCFGNADDNGKGRQMPVHYTIKEINWVSVSSPLGTQVVQAAGAARAAQIKGTDEVVITWFGDGSTSTNDFHAGMNFAGVWKAPCVFFCNNNLWAISTPIEQQCAAATLADKAIGYGMPAIRVDGNDVLAVAQATKEAVDRARSGGGPTFIEAMSYRMGPHSSSDDNSIYQPKEEREEWERKDPLARFRSYLLREEILTDDEIKPIEDECAEEIMASFKRNEGVPKPTLASMFEDVYAEMHPALLEQQAYLMDVEGGLVREDDSGAAFPL